MSAGLDLDQASPRALSELLFAQRPKRQTLDERQVRQRWHTTSATISENVFVDLICNNLEIIKECSESR